VLATLEGLDRTVETLTAHDVAFRIDPVIEPIGFGFAASLGRYLEVRRRYPQTEMMMGVGNLTELTDVDSAGINVLLLGFCQELGIRSVLTTEVINWCRSSVREIDLARKLMYYACNRRVLPKHLVAIRAVDSIPPTMTEAEGTPSTLRRLRIESESCSVVLDAQCFPNIDPDALTVTPPPRSVSGVTVSASGSTAHSVERFGVAQ
jgi:hypothetical protein